MNLVGPIFFKPNRVFSPFKGGRLLDGFFDGVPENDENLSEEWLASVEASAADPKKGISEIVDEYGLDSAALPQFLTVNADSIFGADYILQHGRNFPLKLRLIDSSERRGIKFTPDTEESPGKPRVWIIVDTEKSDGKKPSVLLGFKDGVNPADVVEATQRDDGRLEMMMNELPVKSGDAFFIPPGIAHAIGAGMLVYEIQSLETRSFYIENKFRDSSAVWPLTLDDVVTHNADDLRRAVCPSNYMFKRSDDGLCRELVGAHQAKDFHVWSVDVTNKMEIKLPAAFAMVLCTGGEGVLSYAGGMHEIRKGDFFLQPFAVPWIEYNATDRLSLILAMPKN